ncbi:dTDP-4-dehydrorhamnose reductase family protein [Sphingomonas melonis]|uniref:dTDP-4-dehydrorhamnose reductase family protein n=1 Tax=Sphingomonas melonis TaxID=152682 RepID=UPI0035C7C47E
MSHDDATPPMRVLVLGASGMLGNAVTRRFAEDPRFAVVATVRSPSIAGAFPAAVRPMLLAWDDIGHADNLEALFDYARPQLVINCIGLVKQIPGGSSVLSALPLNSMLPHRLSRLCGLVGARLVHVSTDCVFSGDKGGYVESDRPDARDVYGLSKFMGEVDYPHAITLRTSIIGTELTGARSLVGWFLAQQGQVRGFRRAIFSGLPTCELARIIRDVVVPRPDLHGLYHVSAAPIDKDTLLRLVADRYGHRIDIVPDDTLVIDRSLDSTRFREATGYCPPEWPALVAEMHAYG